MTSTENSVSNTIILNLNQIFNDHALNLGKKHWKWSQTSNIRIRNPRITRTSEYKISSTIRPAPQCHTNHIRTLLIAARNVNNSLTKTQTLKHCDPRPWSNNSKKSHKPKLHCHSNNKTTKNYDNGEEKLHAGGEPPWCTPIHGHCGRNTGSMGSDRRGEAIAGTRNGNEGTYESWFGVSRPRVLNQELEKNVWEGTLFSEKANMRRELSLSRTSLFIPICATSATERSLLADSNETWFFFFFTF